MSRTLKEVGKGNLSAMEFTMLCLLNNDLQLNEGNVIERHNAYFMKCLNLSERQVQRLFKSLEEKGYVEIKRTGTSKNRKENSIRLKKRYNNCDKNDDIYGDKNVTLKKTRKELEKNNKIKNLSIPVNATSIPGGDKIVANGIYFEDTPLIEFTNRAEECFEQLDDFFSTEKKIEILSVLKEEAKGVVRAKQVVEDLIVSYGEKLGWTETFKSQLLEELFPNADA